MNVSEWSSRDFEMRVSMRNEKHEAEDMFYNKRLVETPLFHDDERMGCVAGLSTPRNLHAAQREH
jgi:hypothetical protein